MELWGSYCLYKHLTSIKKRQEDSSHRTEHLRKMTRRVQQSALKNTNREDRRESRKRHYSISGEVQETVHVVVMQNRPAPPLLDWKQVGKRWREAVRTEHRFSPKSQNQALVVKTFSVSGGAGTVQFCVVLGWTKIPEFCCCAGPRRACGSSVDAAGLRWIWRGLFSGRRASSTFPRLSGATPRP